MTYKRLSGFSDEIAPDIQTQFKILNKLGIEYFEPRGVNGKNISALSDEELRALKEQMQQYGIRVSSIGSPIGKVKVSDDLDAHFELFKRVVHIAKELNTRYIRVFSFYCDGNTWSDNARDTVISRLTQMIDYAKKEDVVLLHENEKDIYGDTADRCADIMDTLGCDNFRAVFDPANFVQCHQDTKDAYARLAKHIEYMHIKDAKLSDGSVTPAGFGDGNIEYILKDLFEHGYKGFLSLEPHLGSFEGLALLELSEEMLKLPKGGEGTFTLAYNSLVNILKGI